MENTLNVQSLNNNYKNGLIVSIFECLRDGETIRIVADSSLDEIREAFVAANMEFQWEEQKYSEKDYEIRIRKAVKNETCCGSCSG